MTGDRRGPSTAGPLVARLRRPVATQATRIAVVADPHLSTDSSGTWKVLHRTERRFRTAVEDCTERGVDGVVFAGDLTSSGSADEFRRFEELLDGLDAPWVAIPGNHDVPTWDGATNPDACPLDEFAESYADGSYPTVVRFGGVDVVGLNSASTPEQRLEGWSGDVSNEQLDRLREILPVLGTPLVVSHHNVFSLPEHPDEEPWTWFPIQRGAKLHTVLSEHDVPLVLSAHHHVPAMSVRSSLREVITPAVSSFPQGYYLLTIDGHGTEIRFVPLASPDGVREAYWFARSDEPLGKGVLDIASSRLRQFPFTDEWTSSTDSGDDAP